MADPKNEVAPSYGEGDIEAKAMTEAGKGVATRDRGALTPPPDVALPAAGTTETDLARNLKDKADRSED